MPPKRKSNSSPASKASNSSPASKASKVKQEDPLSEKELVLRTLCVDTIRILSADMVEKANSGHPGAPMGCASIAHVSVM